MSQRKLIFIGVVFWAAITASVRLYAQVNLQTGSAVFSLPIFNWKDNQSRLNSVVALGYNSGNGLRVNDVASNVGQGWSLVAGGVVTRMQVGEPDDQPAYSGTPQYGNGADQDLTKYPAGYLYAPIPASQGCPNALTRYPIYGSKNQVYTQRNAVAEDRQLDYFAFQFNGKTGLFILNTANGDNGVSLGDSKMIITFQRDPTMTSQGIRTTITSFQIKDVDGLIYKFTGHGLTKLLKSSFCDAKVTKQQTQPNFGNGGVYHQAGFDVGPTAAPWVNSQMANPYVINNWYLSEIDEPLTGRKILFNYYTRNINNIAGADISYNQSSDNYVIISHKTSITTSQEIASIVYPDGHTVTFNYSGTQRADFSGQYPMSSVDITYQPRAQDPVRYLSEYQLKTSYFILNRYGTPVSDYEKSAARLCLLSVKKIGVDLKEDSPPYIFDYYTGGDGDNFVPPPFFYAKDVWGFYNGSNSVKSNNSGAVPLTNTTLAQLDFYSLKGLCFLNDGVTGLVLNAKANYAQNGLMRQIIYPTGGSLTYSYAQNTGGLIGGPASTSVGGVHVAQTSSADGGYSNGCANPIITSYNYVMNGTGSASSLWGMEMPVNSITNNNYFAWEKQTIHFGFDCPLGCCKWHYMYPGILSQDESVDLTSMQQIMNALAPVLGVLTVITDVIDVINVCLDATPLVIVAVALDIISAALTWIFSCSQFTKYTSDQIFYNFDLNGGSSLPGQYKRVEVVENPGTIGKTVQEFTSADDYPIWVPSNPTFSAKQRFAPWAYGLPKLTTVYDVNGNIIRQTRNVYNQAYAQNAILTQSVSHQVPPPLMSCKCQVIQSSSQRNTDWSNATLYNDPTTFTTTSTSVMNVDLYPMYTGRFELDSTYERVYRVGNALSYVETATKFTYDPYNYLVNSTTTVQSNGDKLSKFISYSGTGGGGLLGGNNILNEPIEVSTCLIPAASQLYTYPIDDLNYYYNVVGTGLYFLLTDKYTQYAQVANSDMRPSLVKEQRFNKPADGVAPSLGYSSNYKTIQTMTYDANSNLSGMKDEGARSVTNIYDYNDKYVVASVINADPVLDRPAYTSFEWGDLSRSGWSLSGSAGYNTNTPSPTGTANFSLLATGGNSLSAGSLNTARPYTLSFWASSGGVSVNGGATLTKSAPTYNGYTYYEYDIAQGTSSVTVINNTASVITIDELRLFPKTARMKTTAYDPLIGKIADCDENNRITYYEYDNLGRLQFIKDESRNILKMYEYNNVSAAKQTGCPATFGNHLIAETFTPTNCAGGYQGNPYPYTVPAGKYTSTVSQWDADIKAEIDVLTNGPLQANTNGTCSKIYGNNAVFITETTQSCGDGYVGGQVTYSVPANTYTSIISQQDADQQAAADTAANAQAYANSIANMVCTLNTAPDWEYTPGDPTSCRSVGMDLQQHLFMLATDVNPNSPSYNLTSWQDSGPSNSCPAATETIVLSDFTTESATVTFTNTATGVNYPFGVNPSTVNQAAGTIPPGTYTITIAPIGATSTYPIIYTINVAGGQTATQTYYATVSFGNVPISGGMCTVSMSPPPPESVTASNSTIKPVTLTYLNTATNLSYTFNVPAQSGNLVLGSVPLGNYNITASPGSPQLIYPIDFTLSIAGGVASTQEYYGAVAWGNVNVNGASTVTIAPPPQVMPVINNNFSTTITLTFTNVQTNAVYTIVVPGSSPNFQLFGIPAGMYNTYNVVMAPQYYSSAVPLIYTIYSFTQTYYATVAFGSVVLTGATCPISISRAN